MSPSAVDPLYSEAIARFADAYQRAQTCGLIEPTALTLATATSDGRPSVRVVLLKSFDQNGFVFFTNFESRKGEELRRNPRAALDFWWPPLEEQVLVEGAVARVSDADADAYWARRPRVSQIGAWASRQSRTLDARETLENRVAEFERRYPDAVPRPPYWSGFRVSPERIEFWKARPFRLHERTVYAHVADNWTKTLLFP